MKQRWYSVYTIDFIALTLIVEIKLIGYLMQFRRSIVFETEITKKMFILTIIFYSVITVRIFSHLLDARQSAMDEFLDI